MHATTFYDGAVSVYISGTLNAQSNWSGGTGGPSVNTNVDALELDAFLIASSNKILNRSSQINGITYAMQNTAEVSYEGRIMVGNGRAILTLSAETITGASLSSDDHIGHAITNLTLGSAAAYGVLHVTLPASVPYSTMKITSDTLPGDRYVESEGSFIGLSAIDSGGASSQAIAPAGVPGKFSDPKSNSYFANVQLTVLYGEGATQGNAIVPSGPATNAPGAQSVINSTMGGGGSGLTYKPGSTETFSLVPKGRWYDPSISYGFVYEALDETLFTEIINLPVGFSGTFTIWAEGQLLGQYSAGDFLNFEELLGHGISSFAVLGITPENDQDGVDVFPIQLGFNTETASFRQHALEPIIQPSLAMSVMPNGWIELLWAAERPSILEQSTTLKMDSWSTALDQGEPAGDDQRRVTFKPIDERRFFRLRLETTQP